MRSVEECNKKIRQQDNQMTLLQVLPTVSYEYRTILKCIMEYIEEADAATTTTAVDYEDMCVDDAAVGFFFVHMSVATRHTDMGRGFS